MVPQELPPMIIICGLSDARVTILVRPMGKASVSSQGRRAAPTNGRRPSTMPILLGREPHFGEHQRIRALISSSPSLGTARPPLLIDTKAE